MEVDKSLTTIDNLMNELKFRDKVILSKIN